MPMGFIRRAARGGLVVAVGMLLVPSALAQAPTDLTNPTDRSQVRFEWSREVSVEGCPTGEVLRSRVVERLGRDPFGAEPTRFIEGLVTRDGAFVATLVVRDPAGELIGRRELVVDEATCQPLADAVVLAVALIIDPNARLVAPSSSPAPSPPASSPPAPAPPPAVVPAAPERVVEPESDASLAGEVSLGLVGALGVLPRLALGPRLVASIELDPRVLVEVAVAFLPEQRDGEVAFGLTTGGVSLCLAPLVGRLRLLGCVGAHAGALHQVVYAPDPVEPGQRAWIAVAAEAVLEVRVVASLVVRGGLGLIVPLIRDRFVVDGAGEIFRAPAVAGLGHIGVGLRFE